MESDEIVLLRIRSIRIIVIVLEDLTEDHFLLLLTIITQFLARSFRKIQEYQNSPDLESELLMYHGIYELLQKLFTYYANNIDPQKMEALKKKETSEFLRAKIVLGSNNNGFFSTYDKKIHRNIRNAVAHGTWIQEGDNLFYSMDNPIQKFTKEDLEITLETTALIMIFIIEIFLLRPIKEWASRQ